MNLLDPSPLDIEIEDIALGLSRVARWNGQTIGDHPFSVAQHSLLVERLFGMMRPKASAAWRLGALLHDAPEYVIGDLISPFKAVVGGEYKTLEAGLMAATHLASGLPAELPDEANLAIKRADRVAAWFEATQLAGFSTLDAAKLFPKPRLRTAIEITLTPDPPNIARVNFLERYKALRLAL